MKVVSTEALTKLIQLVKSAFVKVEDVVETQEVTLADVAISGDYDDLINKPTIGNATLTITQGGVSKGTFTANASSDVTIDLDSGGGSSYTAGTGIDITNNEISVDNTIALKSEIPTATSDLTNDSGFITSSALTGYATQAWVGQQGYITGITSSDVTTALGYTPYNASNPSGYITNSALDPYALSADLASVATSGSYNDLSNKPDLSAKANIDLSNCTKPHIVETYVNGTSWYRVYSDGWCEQGGIISPSSSEVLNYQVSLLKAYSDTSYSVFTTYNNQNLAYTSGTSNATFNVVHSYAATINRKNTGYFYFNLLFPQTAGMREYQWEAKGYIS